MGHPVCCLYQRDQRLGHPPFICGNCNSADGAVKRRFKLPVDFSFSPQELSKFVVGHPHDGVEIDFEAAKSLYDSVSGPP
jgi:hypothetical protein